MKPGWQGLRGHQRVAAECKQLGRDIAAGKLPQLWDLEPHNDAASIWRVKLRCISGGEEGAVAARGQQLRGWQAALRTDVHACRPAHAQTTAPGCAAAPSVPACSRFDEDLPGGAQINHDLQQLARQ